MNYMDILPVNVLVYDRKDVSTPERNFRFNEHLASYVTRNPIVRKTLLNRPSAFPMVANLCGYWSKPVHTDRPGRPSYAVGLKSVFDSREMFYSVVNRLQSLEQ